MNGVSGLESFNYFSSGVTFVLRSLCRVHLAQLRLRDFRNYERLDVEFSPGFQLLLGDNAQGKTNLLESLYVIATLRSFRGVGGSQMIRQGEKGYFIGGSIEGQGSDVVKIYWSQKERKLSLNGETVRQLNGYLGTMRAVVFCTEDLQLVKGTARVRRRFMDLLLSQTHDGYLPLLQRYMKSARSRNAILKQRTIDDNLLESFSRELIVAGNELIKLRRELVPRISPLARLAYRRISNDAEDLKIEYAPSIKEDFATELAKSRQRERSYRSTIVGPHRDDLKLSLSEQSASQFGSEGQKRSLVVALKMAQAEYLTGMLGFPPILLIDDVMGELDLKRRSGMLPLLERTHHTRGQVFMTCTERNWPRELERQVTTWHVERGQLISLPSHSV